MKAVIQAGGQGTRLRPYTLILPKPLMPVGELPVIEMLLKWLRRSGVDKVCITLGHLGHLIRALCGDGRNWGMQICYCQEPEPLGTVGALNLLCEHINEPFLMLNGDLITDLDLRAFMDFHRQHDGLVTVGVTRKDIKVDLGVIELGDGNRIAKFLEKPTQNFTVSMGIYCMDPEVVELIPQGVPFGFDDLMLAMLDNQLPIYVYEHQGIWMDIGRHEDFKRAQDMVKEECAGILGI